MEELLKGILSEIQSVKNQLNTMDSRMAKVEQSVTVIEQNHSQKIGAIYDGFQLRGNQIEKLQEHLDERLDSIQNDLSYVVGKMAQHERNFIKLNNRKVE